MLTPSRGFALTALFSVLSALDIFGILWYNKERYQDIAQLAARLLWERAVVFGCGFQKSEQSGEKRRKREEIASSGCRQNRSDHRFDHS